MSCASKYVIAIIIFSLSTKSFAQLDSSHFKIVQKLTAYIKNNYVSIDIARNMSDTINWKFANGKYEGLSNLDEFFYELTKDLRCVSNDQHIIITPTQYKPFDELAYENFIDKMSQKQKNRYFKKSQEESKEIRLRLKQNIEENVFNYGDVKILPGNVGYIEIKNFGIVTNDRKKERITFEKVLDFLKNTDALIIDLRDNQGGFIKKGASFCSFLSPKKHNYFVTQQAYVRYTSGGIEKEDSFLDTIFTSDQRDNNNVHDKSIYLLTSHRTFSAAEMAAYKIKQYNPSTIIIGEKTEGGGNGYIRIENNKYFNAVVPNCKVFDEQNNSFTLEAKGIQPDVITTEDSALLVCYQLITKNQFPLSNSDAEYLVKTTQPAILNEPYFNKFYNDYIGDYKKAKVIEDNDKLYLVYDVYQKVQLLPEAVDYFTSKWFEFVKFIRNDDGKVGKIQIKHTDEFTEVFTKQ